MNKHDVYQEVTDRIVAALEGGTVPWHKPWTTAGTPFNVENHRAYRGINVFLLSLMGYGDPRWGTYRAISACGGQVRKGEKATHVILWKPIHKKRDGESEGDGERRDYLLLRSYAVFNAAQADGLPELEVEKREHTPVEEAEDLLRDYLYGGPAVIYGRDQASYSPLADKVYMPNPEAFESGEAFYQTFFHELVHSTGHESRLKRIEPALFGTDPYAREELVAEMGAAMLSGLSGLENAGGDQSAAYIAGWLKALANDRKLVIQAAAKAQKAVDLIAGVSFEEMLASKTDAVAV